MSALGNRFLILGVVTAVAVWSAAFSLHGAYRRHAAEGGVFERAESDAAALAGVLDSVAAEGPEFLEGVLAGMARSSRVRGTAVVGADGVLRAVSPGLALGDEPRSSPACAECHRSGEGIPKTAVVRSGEVLHLFRPRSVRGDHLYLALHVGPRTPGVRDLSLVFIVGLGMMGTVVVVLFEALRRWVLCPTRRLAEQMGPEDSGGTASGFGELMVAAGDAFAAHRRIEEDLLRCAAGWGDSGAGSIPHLVELKQGLHTTLEIGNRVLDLAGQLRSEEEEFQEHFGKISESTSDNSSSLIQMSASIDEVANGAGQLSHFVISTAASVEQMVEAIGEVADRVETLARETDATASSMAHIDASTREIEINAREATILSGRMAEAARDGSHAVEETLQGIHSSYGVIQETARAMDELQESSLAIGGVVKIINEINDKTKLLALNAAIIAAQAGEHGKSFAVVAHEIKNLSDRTASSTGEISRLIVGIRERMAAAAEAVARGQGATGSSVELAERAGDALRHISETAQVSHDMTREILGATEEQSRGSQKVMTSMEEVSAMVTYIRKAAREHRSSGEAVASQTDTMRELTEQVKLATAEQAEVSRYISDAIAAIDRNLHTIVDAVDHKRENLTDLISRANELRERSEADALEVQALEDSLRVVSDELLALGVIRGPEPLVNGESDR